MNKTIEIKVTDSIVELKNVFVGNHGIIYDNNGDMINREIIFSGKTNSNFGVNNHIKSFMSYKAAKYDKSLLDDENDIKEAIFSDAYQIVDNNNYIHQFHFFDFYVWGHLWDNLGLLEDFENLNIDFKLAISQITPHVSDLFKHFKLVGYEKNKVVSFPSNKGPYFFPTLFVNKDWNRGAYIRNKKWIEQKYIYNNPEIEFDKLKDERYKLFLSRSKYKDGAKYRQILNEDIIWDILKDKGYIRLYGDEGLTDHIKYFMNAEKIITAHGSFVRNMAFCLRDPEIWEFFPSYRLDMKHFPWFHTSNDLKMVAKEINLNKYFFIVTESDKDQNIIIDPEFIKIIGE